MRKKFVICISIIAFLIFVFLIFNQRESGRGTNMICYITDTPFFVNGEKALNLSIMAGNYKPNIKYMPKFGVDGDLDWVSKNGVLTLNFHPRTKYKSSRGWGKWADNQHWAYIGISHIYQDESIVGMPRCGMPETIKIPELWQGDLHLKVSVKASTRPENKHLLKWPIRIGGTLADDKDHYVAENMIEIDNMPNIGRSLNNAECQTFNQDWGATYGNFQYGDWILENNKWTEIDLNLNEIALIIQEKCGTFNKGDDVYINELIIGSEFKVRDGEITIQVKNFEIYVDFESN